MLFLNILNIFLSNNALFSSLIERFFIFLTYNFKIYIIYFNYGLTKNKNKSIIIFSLIILFLIIILFI